MAFDDSAHHGAHRGGIAHIGAVVVDAAAAQGAEAALEARHQRLIGKAVQGDVRAGAGQLLGDAEADAAGRTGDEGDLIFQHGVDSWVCSMAGVDAREDRSPRPRPARVARHDRRAE